MGKLSVQMLVEAVRQLNNVGSLLLLSLSALGLMWVLLGGSDSMRRTTRALIYWTALVAVWTGLFFYLDQCEGVLEDVCSSFALWQALIFWFIGFVALSLVWFMSREGGQPSGTTDDGLASLSRLAGLRDEGVITEEEFQLKKQQLLDRL